MTGARLVQHRMYDSQTQPILDQLSGAQMSAASMNPDLRKKLRVDRVRKMTLGSGA